MGTTCLSPHLLQAFASACRSLLAGHAWLANIHSMGSERFFRSKLLERLQACESFFKVLLGNGCADQQPCNPLAWLSVAYIC